jgi:hypothetical protein
MPFTQFPAAVSPGRIPALPQLDRRRDDASVGLGSSPHDEPTVEHAGNASDWRRQDVVVAGRDS